MSNLWHPKLGNPGINVNCPEAARHPTVFPHKGQLPLLIVPSFHSWRSYIPSLQWRH